MNDNGRYQSPMFHVVATPEFTSWLDGLRDRMAQRRVAKQIERARFGNLGKTRSLGEGLSEMKIDHGQGYRIYFARRKNVIIVLLCGGDKQSQDRDIAKARNILKGYDDATD